MFKANEFTWVKVKVKVQHDIWNSKEGVYEDAQGKEFLGTVSEDGLICVICNDGIYPSSFSFIQEEQLEKLEVLQELGTGMFPKELKLTDPVLQHEPTKKYGGSIEDLFGEDVKTLTVEYK